MINNKKCPECGAKIVGRSDKKYCSVKCKNTCLNRIKKQNKNKNVYFLCYDYGIRKLDENSYLIIKRQPYMQK